MALDMFLDINGIKGESRDKAYAGKIDILSWKWGVGNTGMAHVGGGIGSGKADVRDMHITKYMDLASSELLKSVTLGTHFPKAKIIVRKSGGYMALEYCTILLDEVMVTDYDFGGEGTGTSQAKAQGSARESGRETSTGDRLVESLTLTFTKFEVNYTSQDSKTGGKAGSTKFAYDIAQNAQAA